MSEEWSKYCSKVRRVHYKKRVPLSNHNSHEMGTAVSLDQEYVSRLKPKHLENQTDPLPMDKRSERRLVQGKYPIDVVLDLHHCTTDEAYGKLRQAVLMAFDEGRRLLLVITGKGVNGSGIIRNSLPLWLSSSELKPYVLKLEQARPADGGAGAFYLLLRRYRE